MRVYLRDYIHKRTPDPDLDHMMTKEVIEIAISPPPILREYGPKKVLVDMDTGLRAR